MKFLAADTEFTNLAPRVDSSLISIGLVAVEDSNRTFYAEVSDFNIDDCSDFVHCVVLPLLDGGDAKMSSAELPTRLRSWIESFDEPVKIVVDTGYDWQFVQEIFSERGSWPSNLDGKALFVGPHNLDEADRFYDAMEKAFASGTYRRHHALDDARVLAIGFKAAGGAV